MVFSLIGTSLDEIEFRNILQLRAELGFTNSKELRTFLDGRLFKPYFDAYANVWIRPQQETARQTGVPRKAGPKFVKVQERMIIGERPGSDKYSTTFPDKSNWDQTDHCAYSLFHICKVNTKNASGLFFNKGLSSAQIHLRAWALIKHEEFNNAPSRVRGRRPPQQEEDLPEASAQGADTAQAEQGEAQGQQPPEAQAQGQQPPPEASIDVPPPPPGNAPGESIPPPPPPPEDDQRIQVDQHVEVIHSNGNRLECAHDADEELHDNVKTGDVLTNAQIMAIENGSKTFNIHERFWKAWLMHELIRKGDDVQALRESVDMASHIDDISKEEQKTWFDRTTYDLEQDSIMYKPWDAEASAHYDEQQSWFDSQDYQRDNLEESCNVLGIPWDNENTIFRMPGMSLSQQMKFWQPVAVNALIQFHLTPHLRAAFLADHTGLGKTWVTICYLLWLKNTREETPEDQRGPAKPILILMPKDLISQWIKAFDLVAPSAFDIYKYHGDGRRKKPVAEERSILGNLHGSHELFDRREQRSRAVIITSYTTFAARHGPAPLRKHRINSKIMSKTEAEKLERELDPLWAGSLRGCFETVVNDECHMLKSGSTDVSTSVAWVEATDHIMISASPIPNGIQDWMGYMEFIEPFDAEHWWSRPSLQQMNFDEDEDPFVLDDDHPAAKLQITKAAVKDWILTSRINPAEKGVRLAKIWKKMVVRRTPQSRIPFGSGVRIADSLPRVKASILHCKFNDQERGKYQNLEDDLTGKLIIPGEGKKKPKWSLAIQRKLLLLTTWLDAPELDMRQDLKATNIRKTFEDNNFFLKWFNHHLNVSMENPAPLLQELLNGAPKIRALFRNLSSQVVRDQEKVLIFCQLPATTVLILAVLRLLHIDVVTLGAFQKPEEREAVIAAFTERDDCAHVLVSTYAVAAVGLNLQPKCWRVHLIESAHNLGTQTQALGRAVRVGNPSPVVWLYEYYVENTFDSLTIWRNIEKAIPQAMAEINRVVFAGEEGSSDDSVDLGDWVFKGGEMVKLDEVSWEEGEKPHILSAHDVLRYILLKAKGEEIVI